MSRTVIDVLEDLEQTSGRNAKLDILEAARNNDLLQAVFRSAQDPFIVYYINRFKMPKSHPTSKKGEDGTVRHFLDTIHEKLATRELTGNAAKALVVDMFSHMSAREQKWCMRVLLHNLRVGVQVTTTNEVWPGLIRTFQVALATPLKSDFVPGKGIQLLEPVTYPVRVEPKFDGLRLIAVKRAGEVTLYTRNGTVVETLVRIQAALEAADYDDVVLDGEAMGDTWNESNSVVMSSKRKKDDANMVFQVFDALPLGDWDDKETTLLYHQRCRLVAEVVARAGSDRVRQVEHITAHDEAQLKAFFAQCMDRGFEGVMLKTLHTPYEWDRSRNIMKLKPIATYEGVVVGHYEGRPGGRHEGLFGGFYVLLPNHVVTRVGGGFKDELRASIQLNTNAWLDRIVECEAQPDPLTEDGLSKDGRMRFPVYMRSRAKQDVDPKVPATLDWWRGLGHAKQQALLPIRNYEKEGDE